MKTTAEVIACTITSLRHRADQYDQDSRVAANNAEQQARSAIEFTEQAKALRDAADQLEAAVLAAS